MTCVTLPVAALSTLIVPTKVGWRSTTNSIVIDAFCIAIPPTHHHHHQSENKATFNKSNDYDRLSVLIWFL
jgi:hypothetical protein